jgi:general stress protein CsbA
MRASLSALTVVEARRLLLHPFLLVGLALSILLIVASIPREGQLHAFLLMGLAVLPLALGVFIAANLAAMRSRRDRAEELLDTLPQDARVRTGAQLLAVAVTVPLAVALLAAAYLLFGAGNGLVVSVIGTRHVPAAAELLQGPVLVLALGAVGVLLGRLAPVAPLALLLAVAVVLLEVPLAAWAPDTAWRWVVPLANSIVSVPDGWTACEPRMNRSCGIVDYFDIVGMAWHVLGLAAVAAVASMVALAAGRRD